MADGAPSTDPRTLFRRSLVEPGRQHGLTPLRTTGRWPAELRGTLYRNGPGLFVNQGHRYRHWFDGDGLVTALRLDGTGAAAGAVKLLDTPGLVRERQRGAAYYGAYGTRAPGLFNPFRMAATARGEGKNPANTSMLAWNERLFALCEAGKPLELDPDTLASIGETDLEGSIPMRFSAHPHRRASDGAWVNFGLRIGRPTELDLTLLRPDGTAGLLGSVRLPFATMIHDFALTERHAIVFLAPLHIALMPLLFGLESFVEAHSWHAAEGTEALVVPLDAPGSVRRIAMEPFWAWHTANAFEDGGQLVVDLVRHEDYLRSSRWLGGVLDGSSLRGDPSGQLARITLDPRSGTHRTELLRHRTGEFPRVAPAVDGRRHRHVFLLEHSSIETARLCPPDAITHVDTETGRTESMPFAPHEFPSEAVFVPRPGGTREAEGWLLTLVYDGLQHLSRFVLLDAEHVGGGPVAEAFLETHVPMGFHGVFRQAR
jgi:all-trans-8'-apo-beta-carotenal 15,15'-oxygenase